MSKGVYNEYFCEKEIVNKQYHCEYCDKFYVHASSKIKHKKTCVKKIETEVMQKKQVELLQEQQNKIEELQKQNEELKLIPTTNIINNTTNNIIINAFGKENIGYLTNHPKYKEIMINCLTAKEHGITKLIKYIYFNPEHPENQNITKPIKKDNFVKIYDGNQWNTSFVKDGIFKVLMKIESEFNSFLEKMEDDGTRVTDPIMKRFMSSVGYALNFDFSSLQYPPEYCEMDDKHLEKIKNNLYTLFLFFINEKTNELISCRSTN
jgi:hypothetical protein